MKFKVNPLIVGLVGLLAMAVFYHAILAGVTGDITHPAKFFAEKWYLFLPLFGGFAIQMYLFQKMRILMHEMDAGIAGTSAGMSGLAMAACCAHHLAELFPVLGFFGAAAFLTQYQDWFLALGIAINFGGAVYMLNKLKHCQIHYSSRFSYV